MARRVVIVDDDTWVRTGRAHALSQAREIEVVGALSHQEALASGPTVWDDADVVLVDAWDDRAGFDRFPGVAVVGLIRSHSRSSDITIIVVTGFVVNEMLRLRMAQAGADLFYGHEEVADPESLAAAVLGNAAPPRLGPLDAGRSGRGELQPDAALAWVTAHGCDGAFEGESQKAIPLTRRAFMHIRREVATRAGLDTSGETPSWREVVRFVNRARGAPPEGPGDHHTPRPYA